MSKNLIKKLTRQKTDDSMARERALQIEEQQMHDVEIDEEDINTEIIAMLAEEILRKTEFFNMYKSNVRAVKDAIAEK